MLPYDGYEIGDITIGSAWYFRICTQTKNCKAFGVAKVLGWSQKRRVGQADVLECVMYDTALYLLNIKHWCW